MPVIIVKNKYLRNKYLNDKPLNKDWRIFALICTALGGMGQGVVAPKLPELLGQAKNQLVASGLSATLMYLGIFVSTFQFGRLADAGRIHWLLAPGLFFYALVLFCLGNTLNPALVSLERFAEGLALSAIFVATDFVLGRQSQDGERGRWLSYYGVALSVGMILGPLAALGVGNLYNTASPLPALVLVGLISCLFGVYSLKVRVPKATALGEELKNNNYKLPPLIAGSAYGIMEASLVAVLPVLAVSEFHVLPAWCLILTIVSAALASIVWGILSDKLGPKRVVLFLLLVLASGSTVLVALALAKVFSGQLLAISSCILFGILAGGLYPIGFAWLLETLPESHYGRASGAFARAYGIGALVGPAVAGVLTERWGSAGLFGWMSLVGAAGFFINFLL